MKVDKLINKFMYIDNYQAQGNGGVCYSDFLLTRNGVCKYLAVTMNMCVS